MLENGRNGHAPPIEPERRAWVERLIAACDRVLADDVPDQRDAYLRDVLADVEALRVRLVAELAAGAEPT